MARLRSPIWWFGGKGNMVGKILPVLTKYPHKRYVEPFGGGASILIAKPPVEVEIYNDLDSGLVNFFKVLADEKQFQRFYRRVALLPYSRELHKECLNTWQDTDDPVEKAARWFIIARQSFGGQWGGGWGSVVTSSRSRGMIDTCAAWLSAIEHLPQVHARLQRVQIEHADFRDILRRYDTPETLFYCDPPYVEGTRKAGKYSIEMTNDDHRDFVQLLLNLQGHAVVSGYAHEIYQPLEDAGWERIDFETACHAVGRTRATGILGKGVAKRMQPRVETLWCSPLPNLFSMGNL